MADAINRALDTNLRQEHRRDMHNPFDTGFYGSDELRSFGFSRVGDDVRIARNCTIVGVDRIELGDHIRIDAFTGIFCGEGRLRIGNRVHIGGQCHFAVGADLTFGDFSGTSQGVRIYTANDDYTRGHLIGPCVPPETRLVTAAPVAVEAFAVLGSGCVVLPGITVGEGATVGALSLVNHDLAPWGVFAGYPARRCGTRSPVGVPA